MGAARFTLISDHCLRIEWAADAKFVDEPSLFASTRGDSQTQYPRNTQQWIVPDDFNGPKLKIERPGFSLTYLADGQPLAEPIGAKQRLRIVVRKGEGGEEDSDPYAVWSPGSLDRRNLGGTLATLDTLKGPPIGEYPTGLLSRSGWALIDDSHGHLLVDDWIVCRDWRGYTSAGRVDWYLFLYADNYPLALRSLAMVSGHVPVPRRRTLGSWFSRYWPYTSADFRSIVEQYRAHGVPLDVMVLDMDWHSNSAADGWTGWSWNRALLPDAEDLLEWLHEHQLDVTLNLHPADGVSSSEDRYAAFSRALGADPTTQSRREFDAGNKRYVEALFDEILAPLELPNSDAKKGVDFWWLDWQQDREVRSIPGLTNLAWLNELFFRASTRRGLRGQGFSRWAGWGDHRHPIHFSGDAHTGWDMLKFQVPFTVAAGHVGCFFWSHDIGGHYGPRLDETMTRWVQFGALSAALRLHSARTEALDRRPWTYPTLYFEAMRRAFNLRAQLMPTIYSETRRSCEQTLPLLRSMPIAWPRHERAYTCPGQYMLGEDLLVAPIAVPGLGERNVATMPVWFPPTSASSVEDTTENLEQRGGWYALESGEHFTANADAIVAAEIDEMPLFVRAGAPLFMQPATERMAGTIGVASDVEETSEQTIILRIYPGIPGESFERTLEEDDGVSPASRDNTNDARTVVTADWIAVHADREDANEQNIALRLRIQPTTGIYQRQPAHRRFIIELGGITAIHDVHIDGRSVTDPRERTEQSGTSETSPFRTLALPTRSIREDTTLDCTITIRDPLAIASSLRRARAARLVQSTPQALFIPPIADDPPDPNSLAFREDYAKILAIASGIGVVRVDAGPCAQADVASPQTLLITPPSVRIGVHAIVHVVDRAGPIEEPIWHGDVALDPSGTTHLDPRIAQQPINEPALGRIARRIVHIDLPATDMLRFSQEIQRRERPIRVWTVDGPHPWDWRQSIDDGSPPLTALHTPSHSSRPTIVQQTEAWACDLAATFGTPKGLAYAHSVLFSPRRQTVTFNVHAADKVAVWINGACMYKQDGHWTKEAATPKFTVELHEGPNHIIVKCPDGWNAWGFTLIPESPHALTEIAEHGTAPAPMHG